MADSARAGAVRIGSAPAWAIVTSRAEGDLRPSVDPCVRPARPWTFVRQVHGARVLVVGEPPARTPGAGVPGAPGSSGTEADALVSTSPEASLAVIGADCALVALASPEGVVAAAHAGWRGLLAGVLGATASTMRSLGATTIEALLGPCIHAECYAFGRGDLDEIARQLGASVIGRTRDGGPALDLPEAVRVALERAGVGLVSRIGGCTGCDERWFSHRARGDTGRHALAVARRPELVTGPWATGPWAIGL